MDVSKQKKRKIAAIATAATSGISDDLFSLALPVPEVKFVPLLAKPAPTPIVEEPSVTYRSVTSYGGPVDTTQLLHPVDRHRQSTKSLAQIKQQKLDKKNAKTNIGGGDNRAWNRRKTEPLPKPLPYRARQNEAIMSTHRASQ